MKEPYVYRNNRNKTMRVATIIIIILIYIFFFTSQLTIPNKITDKSETTKIGQNIEYGENRSYTLISAVYSEDQSMIEIVMQLQNSNFDGIDSYYYAHALTGSDEAGTYTKEVINDQIITVVRINSVKEFDEILFQFAPKTSDDIEKIKDESVGEIVLNKHNLTYRKIDTKKTKYDYLKERLDTVIADYEKKLISTNNKISELETQVLSLTNENEQLEKSKSFITSQEYEDALIKISDNEQKIIEAQEDVENYKKKAADIDMQIKEAMTIRDTLEAE